MASPGEAGGVSGSSAWPPSTKICVPGSAGDRSSSCHWPIVAFNVTWVRAVTGTPSRSVRRRRNLAGVRPSYGALGRAQFDAGQLAGRDHADGRAAARVAHAVQLLDLDAVDAGAQVHAHVFPALHALVLQLAFLADAILADFGAVDLEAEDGPRRPLTMMEVWAMGRVWPSFRLSRPSSGSASGSSSSSGRAVAASGAPAAFAASVRVARGAGDFPSRPGAGRRRACRAPGPCSRSAGGCARRWFHELRLRLEVAAHAGGGFVALGRGGVAAREHFCRTDGAQDCSTKLALCSSPFFRSTKRVLAWRVRTAGEACSSTLLRWPAEQHRACGRVVRSSEHVRQRTQAVEAVFALAVGDGEGAVFQVQAHAGDADFAGFLVLDAIAVAVQRDLANDEGLFREHAADHFHPRRGFVRAQRAAGGAGAVDAVALQGADVHAHAIGQAQRFLVGQAQRRQLEAHRQPALPLGVSSGSTALAPAAVMTRAEPCW